MPPLPALLQGSPQVVHVFDEVRSSLEEDDKYAEFYWFAREYPRCYRFHVSGATFRLQSIYSLMSSICWELERDRRNTEGDLVSLGISNRRVEQVYWDFESFLSEVNVALDLLARCVGPAFRQESPPSFNRLCKWDVDHPLIHEFRRAKKNWVNRLKDYRDCFVHYTPVDTVLSISLVQYASGWALRAKLPKNPNAREILRFRHSRRNELLRYAIHVYRRFLAFDRAIAQIVQEQYASGRFPVRYENLFSLGQRSRPQQRTEPA
jgi:hypothetical protein